MCAGLSSSVTSLSITKSGAFSICKTLSHKFLEDQEESVYRDLTVEVTGSAGSP
jgi:hypothetical protein